MRRAHQIDNGLPNAYPISAPVYRKRNRLWERAMHMDVLVLRSTWTCESGLARECGVSELPGLVCRAYQIFDDLPISHAYPVTDPVYRKRMRLWERAMHMDVLVPRSTWTCESGLARECGMHGATCQADATPVAVGWVVRSETHRGM
jgi:hypothetical protein